MPKRIDVNDIIDKTFGRLTVLKFIDFSFKTNSVIKEIPLYKCICTCGNIVEVNRKYILNRTRASCGCLKKETSRNTGLKLIKENTGFNTLYSKYRRSAKIRNINFGLSTDEFKILTKQNCYYCGDEPMYKQTSRCTSTPIERAYIFNGIDRIDSNKGYFLENCVTCCGVCNKMKMALAKELFLNKIVKIYNNLELKGIKETKQIIDNLINN